MTRSRKSARRGSRKKAVPVRAESARAGSSGRRWAIAAVATIGVLVVGIAGLSQFWRIHDPSHPPVEPESATGLQIAQRDPSAAPVQPVPVAPVPVEPVPAPPNSPTTPNLPTPSLDPWGPLPETGEDFKEEALEVVRRVVEDYPRSAEALELMGTTLHLYGNTPEAEKWWQKCLDEDPGRAQACRRLGQAAFRRKEYEKAASLLRKAKEIDPDLDGVHEDLADVFLERGDLRQAVETFQQWLDVSPERYEPRLKLAQALFQLREYEKAVENYQKAAELNPSDSATQYGLANVYARMRQRDKAAEAMQKFKDLQGDEKRAEQQGRMAARDSWDGHTLLGETLADVGRIYGEQGDLRKAQHSWERGMAVDSRNKFCREELFNLYTRNGRTREALELCEQLRQLDPGNASYHLNAGYFLTQSRQFPQAEEASSKAIELAPTLPLGHRFLAELLLLQPARFEDAKAAAERLVELEPKADSYSVLCRACEKAGDSAGALAAIERSIELNPVDRQYKLMRDRLQANR